jgi:PAS domain S-box-containing protein
MAKQPIQHLPILAAALILLAFLPAWRLAADDNRWAFAGVAVLLMAALGLVVRHIQRLGREMDAYKQLQAALDTANAELETRVAERTAELRDEAVLHAISEVQVQHANRALRVIAKVNEMLHRARDETALFYDTCRVLVETGGYRLCWIGQSERDEAKSIRPLACAGVELGVIEAAGISWDEVRGAGCPVGQAIRSGAPALLQDAPNDPDFAPWRDAALQQGFAAVLVLPLKSGDSAARVLCVYAAEADAFDAGEMALLQQLAADLSCASCTLRTQDAFAQAKEQIALLLTALPLILYTCRAAGDYGVTYISPNAEQVTGLAAGRFLADASFWSGRIHPEDRTAVFDALQGLFGQTNLSHEYRWRVADGGYRWFYDSLHLVRDASGAPAQIVGAWLDITERKQAEQLLRESEAKYRTLYESSRDAIMTLVPEQGFVVGNAATLTLFGCRDEREFAALSPARTSPEFQPDGRRSDEKAQEMMRLAMENGAHFFEWRHKRVDGTEFPADVLLTRMEIDGEQLLQATVRDIGERKKADMALADAKREIESAYEMLARKNRLLVDANRARFEFLATLSHELKTPLNAIIGFSEMLKEGLAGELAPRQQEFCQDIYGAGEKLLALITEILEFAYLEAGQGKLNLELVDARHLLAGVVEEFREDAAKAQIALVADAPSEFKPSLLDAKGARQILRNLLSNALKFTPSGGSVRTAVRVVPREQLRNTPGAFERYLEITVSDTGIGIAPELLPKLFEPFRQADGSLTRSYGGVGMGLALVKRLVELNGGAVAAAGEPGQGARFTVWLPYRREFAEGGRGSSGSGFQTATESYRAVEGGPTLESAHPLALVVEDDDHAAELICLQLHGEGLRTAVARTAEQGLEMAEMLRPVLITLDILLPGMDGWAFLEQLKHNSILAQIPVVIISIVADQRRGMALGAARVIQKPYQRFELAAALAAIGYAPSADERRTVLVVDDDPGTVKLAAGLLETIGYTVIKAYGGREGIYLARQRHPDLIILDLMMPEITGFDVARALHEQPDTAQIPILVATAKDLSKDERQELKASVRHIIRKSAFDADAFLAEVRRALDARDGKK